MTVEIPSKQWTLMIGLDESAGWKYSVSVNGVDIFSMPEAPMTAAS